MILVSGVDDRFAMPLAVTFYSALANLDRDRAVSLYIIDGGISEENRRRLTQVLNVHHVKVHIEWVKPDLSLLSDVRTTQWHSQASYLRLLIPELVPKQCDRVIYLDSDLVVEEDLGQPPAPWRPAWCHGARPAPRSSSGGWGDTAAARGEKRGFIFPIRTLRQEKGAAMVVECH